MQRVTAIIPAKSYSRRVPGKNLRPFAGQPLVAHKVEQLMACETVTRVVVASDSHTILQVAARAGADTLPRSSAMVDEDRTPLADRMHDIVSRVDGDVIVWAHCTNPLCDAEHYDAAVRAFLGDGGHDSLASVTTEQRHAWFKGEPLNFNPWGSRHPFASELPPVAYQNGAIFIQRRADMLANRYFYGRFPLLFPLPFPAGWDVDTEDELHYAELLYSGKGATCPA